MGKIKHLFEAMSLRKSIVCYITAFAMVTVILSMVTSFICNSVSDKIHDSYPISGEKYYLTNAEGEKLGEGAYIGEATVPMTVKDQRLISALELIPIIAIPIYSALCVLAAALLFYQNKLKKPLNELKSASEKISHNDLDFVVDYQSTDELGQLCSSFETMRSALEQNYVEMWRQMEERKRLNAAFAHDLRTPLTVLKGYNEMLQYSTDPKMNQTVATMSKHISRLEQYVDNMSRLQRLEEARPEGQIVNPLDLTDLLQETASLVCSRRNKKLAFERHVPDKSIAVDPEFITQVYDNLISNAVRHAVSHIRIDVCGSDAEFSISVSNDGPGFSKESLKRATDPYFTEESNHAENFGLGLYICKLLCERHDGSLKIQNTDTGSCVTAFFRNFIQ